MKIYGGDKSELMVISGFERDDGCLVIKGKIFGAMPMTAVLRPEELRSAFRLLDLKTLLFIVSMLFRRSTGS
jgi:hypothetical protein